MRLLLVEDDAEIAAVVSDGLTEHGHQLRTAGDFRTGCALALADDFDLLILDVMLPGGSGFDVCRAVRTAGRATPILMLTARDSVDDRVAGLDAGADDYLTKPFAFRELLARVRALGRRRPGLEPEVVYVADLEVDLGRHRVIRAGHAIELTAKEFTLLACFVEHRGQVIDRALITAHVWDDNHDPFTNVLEVLIRRLRRKIDDGHDVKLIQTFRGAGYRLGD
ncbi:MAG TPA: response regulator transcription factor [Gemmatimonadales bacterium]|jgi:two-component system copper resistance phosphate regulon response regulator CusR